MNVYTMVVIIVVVTTLGGVAHRYLKLRERRLKIPATPDPGTEQRLARIEERVKVLEQIVTDSRYNLDRAFEDLEHDNGSGEQ